MNENLKIYYPYPIDDKKHKFFIMTNTGKKVKFGAYGMSDYTIHKDFKRKKRYVERHRKREEKYWNKNGVDTPSFWSRYLLWGKPSFEDSYEDIKKKLIKWNIIS